MNASYFLYASLEHGRPVAHGRMPPDDRHKAIITGTPVAGVVYLDRPSPAGYFIYPDLSVRHEGIYRLCFNLFEELKDENDLDAHSADTVLCAMHRLEVKTTPFPVYIAKKFPGLSSSTTLSRTFAEQGCRVRIRRDVRLRKPDKLTDYGDYHRGSDHYGQRYAANTSNQQAQPSMPVQRAAEPYALDKSFFSPTPADKSTPGIIDRPQVPRRSSMERTSRNLSASSFSAGAVLDQSMPYGYKQAQPAEHSSVGNGQINAQSSAQYATQSGCLPQQHTRYGAQVNSEATMLPPTHYNRDPFYQVSDQTARPTYHTDSNMSATVLRPLAYRATNDPATDHQVGVAIPGTGLADVKSDPETSYSSGARNDANAPRSMIRGRDLPRLDTSPLPLSTSLYNPSSFSTKPLDSQHYPLSTTNSLNPSRNFLPPLSQLSNTSSPSYSHDALSNKRRFDSTFDSQHLHSALHSGARPETFNPRNLPEIDCAGRSQMRYRRADGREMVRLLPPTSDS